MISSQWDTVNRQNAATCGTISIVEYVTESSNAKNMQISNASYGDDWSRNPSFYVEEQSSDVFACMMNNLLEIGFFSIG